MNDFNPEEFMRGRADCKAGKPLLDGRSESYQRGYGQAFDDSVNSLDDLPKDERDEADGVLAYWDGHPCDMGRSIFYLEGYRRAYSVGEAMANGYGGA